MDLRIKKCIMDYMFIIRVICKYTKLEDKNIVVIESQDGKVLHAMIALADKK